ncbi:LacI family DNA-binding transcriptional regulator [Rubrivirga sp.]|uniref:LacI family DNA-binding transcriptional regulator n=1 Tax=Rubrivirga sp. TaxID=1885344 RepID=UPI003B528A14
MAVTLNDIAERVGVSVSTVSRVLNKKATSHRISTDTESLVLQAARDLDYKANHLARGLRLSQTNTIGVVAPDVSNPFFARVVKRIQTRAHALGYSLIVCDSDESLDLEVEQVNLLYRKRVDGLIAMPVGQHFEHFEEWAGREVPLVLVDRGTDALEVDSVIVDNYRGAFEATEHFLDHGHHQIAVVQGLGGTSTNTDRLAGYHDALAARGVSADDRLLVGGDFGEATGYAATGHLLDLDRPPTAIFATGDLITLGALQAIDERGLSIPDDVSLISFDDFDFAPFLRCPLTAVEQPKGPMGEAAVDLFADQIVRPGRAPRRVTLRPRLVVRESVRPPDGETG